MPDKYLHKREPFNTDFYNFEGKLTTEPIISFMRRVGKNYSGKLIDVGCGKMPYKSYFPNVERYVGVDQVKQSSIRDDADFIAADINKLPFRDGEFDIVLLNQVIEHVSEPAQLLKEIRRILVDKGTLILTAPQMGRLHGEPDDYYRFTKYGLTFLLERQGFVINFIESQGGFWRAMGSHLNFYIINTTSENRVIKAFVRRAIISPVSSVACYLDKTFFWNLDTLGYNLIAVKD